MSAKKNAPRWIRQLKLVGRWPAPRNAPAAASVWLAAEIDGSGPAALAFLLISGRAQLVLWGWGFCGNVLTRLRLRPTSDTGVLASVGAAV